jgi:hypothetical protein
LVRAQSLYLWGPWFESMRTDNKTNHHYDGDVKIVKKTQVFRLLLGIYSYI